MTVTSRDGTALPMFLVHRKGVERDGKQPALLTGYGGFDISMLPTWTPSAIPFLEAGGTYALAVLRGGGEYGEAWHQAGMLGAQAERVRRLHRGGRVAGRQQGHQRPRGWRSPAARTGACWSAPR